MFRLGGVRWFSSSACVNCIFRLGISQRPQHTESHPCTSYVVDVDSNAIADAVNDFYAHNRELNFIENVKIEKEKYSWSNMAFQILKSD